MSNPTSELPVNPAPGPTVPDTNDETLVERSKSVHLGGSHPAHDNFLKIVQEWPDYAEKYLTLLKNVSKKVLPAENHHMLHSLLSVVTGRIFMPWDELLSMWNIKSDTQTQDDFLDLIFLGRYPQHFSNEKFDKETRIKLVEKSHQEGQLIVKKIIQVPILQTDLIKKGYLADYVGHDEIVTPTLTTLRRQASLWNPRTYLAPYTVIVGPSMIGKSRLLMELAKEVPVVYFCLRPEGSSGEPARSLLADMWIKSTPSPDDYFKLLAAIFSVTTQYFKTTSKEDTKEKILQDWNTYHTDSQSNFSSDVKKVLANLEFEKNILLHLPNEATKLQETLSKTLSLKPEELSLLLAVDEASALIKEAEDENVTMFRMFRRALRELPPACGIFAVLVDTTSRVANFLPRLADVPRLANDKSARPFGTRVRPRQQFSPIYQISTHDRMVSADPPKTWNDLFSHGRLLRYGVPFYSISFEDCPMKPALALSRLFQFALSKLLYCNDTNEDIKITEIKALALFGVTIGVPLQGQARQNIDMTASHVAHCAYIDQANGTQYAFYPSQPIYAAVANDYLHKNENKLIQCINLLTTALSRGDVTTGDAGEFATRIILLCAMNATLDKIKKTSKDASRLETQTEKIEYQSFPEPVPVVKFLETLTGKSEDEMDIGLIDPDNKKRLLHQGHMFWNHFIFCTKTPTCASLMKCLYRGLALQCKPFQPAFDQCLTIYLKDKSESELNQENITFCGVQVKNQKKDDSLSSAKDKMTPEVAGININSKNPYLALYFSLQKKDGLSNLDQKHSNVRKSGRHPHQPCRQAFCSFSRLDQFSFLSHGLKVALNQLINVRTGLDALHALHGDDESGSNYINRLLGDL